MSKEGIEEVKRYLNEQGADYELVEHEERFTAASEAQAAGVEPADAAKLVILRDAESYVMAVIPASQRLDLGKARRLLEASRSLRLATEEEIGRDFERFEVGAIPPFGPLHGVSQIVDRRLLEPRPSALQRRGSRARRTGRTQRDGPVYQSPRGRPCEE